MRIDQQAHVGQGVLDLLAVVKTQAADDLVRNFSPPQAVFQHPRLCIGAVEDGEVVQGQALGVLQPQDVLANDFGFVGFVVGAKVTDRHAARVGSPQRLFPSVGVLRNDRRGGLEDGARRAVILFQLDDLGVRVVALEGEDVAHVGAAEAIHALVVVAHHAQVAVLCRQQVEQVILRHVGVLVLVHHEVPQTVLIALTG